MTYKSSANWAENNVPKDEFDNFEDWYNFVVSEHFYNVNINSTGEFRTLMKEFWEREMGIDEEDIQEEKEPIPSEIREIQTAREELRQEQLAQADSTVRELEAIRQFEKEKQAEETIREVIPEVQQYSQPLIIPKPTVTQRISSQLSNIGSKIAGLFRRKKE